METHACQQSADDVCSYSCITQDECQVNSILYRKESDLDVKNKVMHDACLLSVDLIVWFQGNIQTTILGDGFVCNCVDHDPERFEFVWSCDNSPISGNSSDTEHQYG